MPQAHGFHNAGGHTRSCCHGDSNGAPRWMNNWAALQGMWVHQSLTRSGDFYISPILPENHLVLESANGYIHCNKRISRARFLADYAHWSKK